MDEDDMIGAYALASLSLNMGLTNLLVEKKIFSEQEAGALIALAKEALKKASPNAPAGATELALGVIDRLTGAWGKRDKIH